MLWEKLTERSRHVENKNNLGIKIAPIDLTHEFAADTTWWKHMQFAGLIVPPNGHDLLKSVLAGRYHRCNCTAFGAYPWSDDALPIVGAMLRKLL